jgi:transposase
MLALSPAVVDAVFSAIEGYLPRHVDDHPLGCHNPRTTDRECFWGILIRLVTGCSWDVAGRISETSESTLRRRRDEWERAGVFRAVASEAVTGYDKVIGLDLTEVAIDGSLHKAPFGGEGTGPNPTDRGKRGWKWSIATDRHGVPFAWVPAAANENDCTVFAPTMRAVLARGLLVDIETVHLDRGYDTTGVREICSNLGVETVTAKIRRRGKDKSERTKRPTTLGMRWPVERTNSWFSNFGQLRRNTDRYTRHRESALSLAVALIITIKLVKWAKRWNV